MFGPLGTAILYDHEQDAMELAVKETIWYTYFGKCMEEIFDKEDLTLEQRKLLSGVLSDCYLAREAVGDIMYLIEMRQWCDTQATVSSIFNTYRSKFYEELSKTANKVPLFKSYFEKFKVDAKHPDIKSCCHDRFFFRHYAEFQIEALFAQPKDCTASKNEDLDIITKNPEISTKKRKCLFVGYEYVTESHKKPKMHPDNIFAGRESILMDRSNPESSKAMELLLEEANMYDSYERCMDGFTRSNYNKLTCEQKVLISGLCDLFKSSYADMTDLMYEVETRPFCEVMHVFSDIDRIRVDVDRELSKIADKVTLFRFEEFKKEAENLGGGFLDPHHEYFKVKVGIVDSRLNPVSPNQDRHVSLGDEDDYYEDLLS